MSTYHPIIFHRMCKTAQMHHSMYLFPHIRVDYSRTKLFDGQKTGFREGAKLRFVINWFSYELIQPMSDSSLKLMALVLNIFVYVYIFHLRSADRRRDILQSHLAIWFNYSMNTSLIFMFIIRWNGYKVWKLWIKEMASYHQRLQKFRRPKIQTAVTDNGQKLR